MKKPDELSDIVYATVVTLFLLWVIGMMSGCSTFEYAARYTVDSYCAIPERERVAVRFLVNAKLYPDRIVVECANWEQ